MISSDDEALIGQGEAALLAVEAILMPGVSLVVHHIGAMAESCDRVLAAMALLGHISLVAVHTVKSGLMGGEASSRQRLTAGLAHETLRVPGLVLVADPSGGDGLLAVEAFLGKLLVMAGDTVDIITLGQEALCADWLLAIKAGEAFLVPQLVLVLHVLGSWHDHLVAALAPVAILPGAALATHYLAVVPGAERLTGQWLVALGTAETVLMPVAVLMVQLLGISTNGASALCAGVGTELIKTLGAHVLVVLLHILLPVQVVTAVVAVEAISHGGGKITPGTSPKRKDERRSVDTSSVSGGFGQEVKSFVQEASLPCRDFHL